MNVLFTIKIDNPSFKVLFIPFEGILDGKNSRVGFPFVSSILPL